MTRDTTDKRLRSQRWFDDPSDPGMTALYLGNYMNFGLTREELQSGRPIIGIAQTGSDLAPCNRHHLQLAARVRDGIRDAGGIPLEFPLHPIQENGKRPTAALDRNLSYLGLVEVLHGYPLDGVVLTTGCDKTTPACLMGAATVNIPAIALNVGPKLDGYWRGEPAGSGSMIWQGRELLAQGKIGYSEFIEMASAAAPSVGHCNVMGTALSMAGLVEAMGMMLPGGAAIPAPYRERGWMAYESGRRIVEMVREDLKPSQILTKRAFENAVVTAAALGGSTNCPPHVIAIARHMGVEHSLEDWQRLGPDVPLLVDCKPHGRHLAERFYRGGGVPAVLKELLNAGRLHGDVMTVTGRTLAENLVHVPPPDREIIRAFEAPMKRSAGMVVMTGNFFDNALMKVSVIGAEFQKRFLSNPAKPDVFEVRAVVFEGPEDYHARIEDPALDIDEECILVIRNCGPVGYPGGAEVVNMQPPASMLAQGIRTLPTLGDGRQSGTSASPSILHVTPEAARGEGLALLQSGDRLRIDLKACRVDLLLSSEIIEERRKAAKPFAAVNQTPWEEIYRKFVGELGAGGCLEFATFYLDIIETRGEARHNH